MSDPPLLIPIDELVGEAQARRHEQQMSDLIDAYRESLEASRRGLVGRFRYAGLARKVVGVGSVGTRAWVVLVLGRDDGDPLLMQVKEAQPSVLEPYLGSCGDTNAAERVVEGQRLMQVQQRHFARLAALRRARRPRGRLLRAPTPRLEGVGHAGVDDSAAARRLRTVMRARPGPCARPHG